MSEVDWDGVLDSYRFLLSRIGSSLEFADLLYEVAAELGTSHAYVINTTVFTARTSARGAAAALLGADVSRAPDGRWLVDRVLPGESSDPRARSPLAAPGVAVLAGDEILEVDGRPVDPVYGPWPALAGTAGKPVELTIRPADPSLVPRPTPDPDAAHDSDSESDSDSDPDTDSDPDPDPDPDPDSDSDSDSDTDSDPDSDSDSDTDSDSDSSPTSTENHTDNSDSAGHDSSDDPPAPNDPTTATEPPDADAAQGMETRRVVVVPLHDERRLRYQDWVAGRRQFVRARSDGRIGYLHVPDMMGEGWAHLHRDLRAEMGREALIVDVRGNRGGHTSQLIVEKLARRVIGWGFGRWLRPESYPEEAPRGPVVALADEFAGSDGDIVTAAIRALRLGPVIGARTWGGVIGIYGAHGLVDGTHITVPRYAFWFTDYGWGVENYGVDPDTEVLITPDDWAADRDPQLEVAVDRALALLAENPPAPLPDVASGPAKRRPPLPPRP
jgi:tricorn protease